MKEDRRKYPRLKIPLELEYQLETDRLCQQATLIDLSAGGVAMMTDDPLPTGGQLAFVRFKLDRDGAEGPATTIETETEVVRCIRREGIGRRSEYLVGARFTNLSDDDFASLKLFVDERLALAAAQDRTPSRRVRCEQPITIQYRRFEDFVNEVATNLSLTGMFIRAKRPRPPGSMLDFSFQLGDDFDLIHGKAEVVWTRPLAEGPERPAGMGIRFLELDEVSQRVLEQILEKGMGQEVEEGEAGDAPALVAELEAERDSLRAQLEETRTELRQAGSAGAEAEIARLVSVAESREAEVVRLGSELENRDAQVTRLSSELENRDAEVARLGSELENRDAEIARLGAALESREADADRLAAESGKSGAKLDSAVVRISDLERRLVAANDRAGALDGNLSSAQARISELETELASAHGQRDEIEETRRRLEEQLAELESDRDRLDSRGDELSADADRLREEREALRSRLQEIEQARGAALEELERERGAAAAMSDLERRLETASREAEAREEKIEQLQEELTEARALAGELERARASRDEAGRRIDGLEAAMAELEEESATRARRLEERNAESEAEIERLRAGLETADAANRSMREELERTEHERGQSAAKCERLGFQMAELRRESEERQRAHHDEIARRAEEAERARREGEARALELERELEAARQANDGLRAEVEQLTDAREKLGARIEHLVEEAEEVRGQAAARDRKLRDEIGTLEGRIARLDWESEERTAELQEAAAELKKEIAERRASEERLRAALEEATARAERLEVELTGATQLEARRLEDLTALRADLDTDRRQRASLEAELAAEIARAERATAEARELEAARRSLTKNQERLEKELATAQKKLSKKVSKVASIHGSGAAAPQSVRRGSLRAAALVGFGLILGFMASYPFETLLVSADPIAIPTAPPAIETARERFAAGPAAEVGEQPAPPPADSPAADSPAPVSPAAPDAPPAAPQPPERPSPRDAVESWAAAWSEQRVGDYLAAYASAFEVPDGLERGAWELQRTERVERPDSIEITLEGFDTSSSGPDSATVRFVQSYAAGAYRDRVAKTLDLVWEADAWRIVRETSVELE